MLNELVKMVVLHVRVPGFESHLWFLAPASSKCHEDGSDVWVPDLSDSAGDCCRHLGSEPADGRVLYFPAPSPKIAKQWLPFSASSPGMREGGAAAIRVWDG